MATKGRDIQAERRSAGIRQDRLCRVLGIRPDVLIAIERERVVAVDPSSDQIMDAIKTLRVSEQEPVSA